MKATPESPLPDTPLHPIAAEAATEGWASSLALRPGRPRPLSLLRPFALRIVAGRDDSPDCGPMKSPRAIVRRGARSTRILRR